MNGKFSPRFGIVVKFPEIHTFKAKGATSAKRIAVGMAPAHLVSTTHDRGVAMASARDQLRRAAAAGITMGKASVITLGEYTQDGNPHPEANFVINQGRVVNDGPHILQ